MKNNTTSLSVVANAFSVIDVATPIRVYISPDETVLSAWEKFMEAEGENWFGIVSKGNQVLGYLDQENKAFESDLEGIVKDFIQPIALDLLVSSTLPLLELIPILERQPFMFVLSGNKITHVVIFQDLDKLPVKLCIFTLLLELERLIFECYSSSKERLNWAVSMLTEKQKQNAKEILNNKSLKETPYNLLSCTSFSMKINLVKRNFELRRTVVLRNQNFFNFAIEVRNSIAHGESILTKLNNSMIFNQFIIDLFIVLVSIKNFMSNQG